MKKHADYFVYNHPPEGFDEDKLRSFLLTAFVGSEPIVKSLLLQGEINLPSLELYINNMVEKLRDRQSTILATDEISGALVGCCVAFTARQGKSLLEDILQLFPIDMKIHYDLYNNLFKGVSLSSSGKVPVVVLNVTVSPVFRHQGVATKMLETLIYNWKQAKQVNSVYVVSTGNGSHHVDRVGTGAVGTPTGKQEEREKKTSLPKNQQQLHFSHQLFLNLDFVPLHRVDYRKINANPQLFSPHLKEGLLHTEHHSGMTLYHKVLKQKKHKPRDAVDGGGTTGSGEGDVSGATSARTSATTRHPKISVIPPTSNAGTAMSSMRSAASTMRTNEQSSSGLNTINQSMK